MNQLLMLLSRPATKTQNKSHVGSYRKTRLQGIRDVTDVIIRNKIHAKCSDLCLAFHDHSSFGNGDSESTVSHK